MHISRLKMTVIDFFLIGSCGHKYYYYAKNKKSILKIHCTLKLYLPHMLLIFYSRRRTMGKSKKSPSGWRSFFSKGWHTTSGRRKNRRPRGEGERPKIGSPIFSEHSPLVLQVVKDFHFLPKNQISVTFSKKFN